MVFLEAQTSTTCKTFTNTNGFTYDNVNTTKQYQTSKENKILKKRIHFN